MGNTITLVVLALIASVALGTSHAAAQERFVQDRFAIGFWVDPPADREMDARYREISGANFTLVLGGFGATTPQTIARQLSLCEKHNLKALVAASSIEAASLPDSPVCWGYLLRDEPNAADFPELRKQVDAVRELRPGKLAYINLFPNYANESQLGTPTYEEYVARFVKEVGVDVLSMDHYPLFKPGADGRDAYCANLEVMRKYALQENIPFWNFFNTMPFGPHTDPTEAQLRWQIYTSLAYGAKGILYFCYYTPVSPEFPKGGAIIARDGRRTRHYEEARRINAEVKNLGPILMRLQSVGVHRIRPEDDPAKVLEGTPVKNLTRADTDPKLDLLVGVFSHRDGRRAVMLNNYHFAYATWPTVEFDVEPRYVFEASKQDGRNRPVMDDSPDMDGLQIALDAGEGRLFILPAK